MKIPGRNSMSSRRRRTSPTVSSYVGLIRFYEEVEEQLRLHPYIILAIAYATVLIILLLRVLKPVPYI